MDTIDLGKVCRRCRVELYNDHIYILNDEDDCYTPSLSKDEIKVLINKLQTALTLIT